MQAFQGSLRTGNPMASHYVRIRTVPSSLSDPPMSEELLFEVNGRPQIIEADDNPAAAVQVFFAVAKPHPNKNVAMLDTFLDLQEEHDRLQHRVAELRARAPRSVPSSPASSNASTQTSMYATTSMVPKHPISQSPQTYPTSPVEETSPSAAGGYDIDNPGAPMSGKNDDDEDPLKKKKAPKKVVPTEQYVCITCGRTDSPEWRKGPLGPKTLCNACGLRWAKQTKVQKLTEEAAAVTHSS